MNPDASKAATRDRVRVEDSAWQTVDVTTASRFKELSREGQLRLRLRPLAPDDCTR